MKPLSLRKKIILVVILMIAFPTFMVWEVSRLFYRYGEDRTTRELMASTLRQNILNIDNQINMAIAVCSNIAFDPALVRYLRFAANRSLNDAEIIDVIFYLNRFLINYEALNPSAQIILYLDYPELLPRNRYQFMPLNEIPPDIYDSLFSRDVTSLVVPLREYPFGPRQVIIQRKYYTVVQSVSGIRPSQGLLALVSARIEDSVLHSIINEISLDSGSYIFFHNDEQIFYARQGDRKIPVSGIDQDIILNFGRDAHDNQSRNSASQERGFLDRITFEGRRYNVYRTQSEYTGWYLTSLISQDSFLAVIRRTAIFTFLIALFFTALISAVTIGYFNRLVRRLEELSGAMEQAMHGNYNVLVVPRGDSEFRSIQTSYNEMVRTIKSHIEDHYEQQLKIQSAEFRVLENQIKPHFLYNTLDVLKFRALREGSEELASNLDDMAHYFRMVLSEGRRFLPLAAELEQCRLYVKIWNFRSDCKIALEAEIPEDLMLAGLANFLLQPLVENAIIHGIRPKTGRSGRIRLAASRKADRLVIDIVDDGNGMSEELRQSLPGDGSLGFGIHNVHSRIRFLYGIEYGLSFPWSKPGDNCVRICLPYRPIMNPSEDDVDPAEADAGM